MSIRTDRKILKRAYMIWNIVILSLLADVALLVDRKSDSMPPWAYSTDHTIPILLLLSSVIAFYPYLQRFISHYQNRYSKSRKIILMILLICSLILPFIEILLKIKIWGVFTFFVVGTFLVIAIYQITSLTRNSTFYSKLTPRNRFFHIKKVDTINFILFVVAVLSTRALCATLSLLYSYNALSDIYFALVASTSLLLLFILKPSISRFYSVCPNCRDLRSKALEGLLMCPKCARKTFNNY